MVRLILAGTMTMLVASVSPAGSPAAESILVTPGWLMKRINDPSLVLLHVGDRQEYDSLHIPGAQLIQPSDISTSANGLRMEMMAVAQLDSILERFGISNRSMIVVYFAGDWVSPSTRVLFTLNAIGLHPYFLDGGMPAWVKAGGAVTNRAPRIHKGNLNGDAREMTVNGAWVRAHLNARGVMIVDSRSHDYYDGSNDSRGRISRPGHIPGARNITYDSVVREDYRMKSPEELRAMFQAEGAQPGDTVVTYCHIGQQATLVLTAARLAGYTVRLYDGSYQDWEHHTLFPVVTGPHPNGDH